jgi:prepilin-type N-terminal cleavage/methylation domain-containing protein
MNEQSRRKQAGYSLAELMTVVAIIAIMSLVTVPLFISYNNANKVKAAMRSFSADLRTARATAITRGREVKLTFKTGANQRRYDLYLGDRSFGTVPTANWIPLTGPGSSPLMASKSLDSAIYFPDDSTTTPQTFTDLDTVPDGWLDVIFYPDGHTQLPTAATSATITIKTDAKSTKMAYAITVSPSGRVLAQ